MCMGCEQKKLLLYALEYTVESDCTGASSFTQTLWLLCCYILPACALFASFFHAIRCFSFDIDYSRTTFCLAHTKKCRCNFCLVHFLLDRHIICMYTCDLSYDNCMNVTVVHSVPMYILYTQQKSNASIFFF